MNNLPLELSIGYIGVLYYNVGFTGLSKQYRSNYSWRSSLIRVYTVCQSVSIFWMYHSYGKTILLNFRIITAIFSCVWTFRCLQYFTLKDSSRWSIWHSDRGYIQLWGWYVCGSWYRSYTIRFRPETYLVSLTRPFLNQTIFIFIHVYIY